MENKKEKIGIQKHIRIIDTEIINAIERIMELPKYNSLSKVVNDGLFYGLPILTAKLFGEAELEDKEASQTLRTNLLCFDEKQFAVIVRLLKEIVLNVTINKSILSSLFHDLEHINKALKIENKLYEQGMMSDTPDYLNDYEIRGLKNLRK